MTNFTLNLVKKNDASLSYKYGGFTRLEFYGIFASLAFSISDDKSLRVPNFMQIYLFLLFRSAILDPLFWISELRNLIYNQWYQGLISHQLIVII